MVEEYDDYDDAAEIDVEQRKKIVQDLKKESDGDSADVTGDKSEDNEANENGDKSGNIPEPTVASGSTPPEEAQDHNLSRNKEHDSHQHEANTEKMQQLDAESVTEPPNLKDEPQERSESDHEDLKSEHNPEKQKSLNSAEITKNSEENEIIDAEVKEFLNEVEGGDVEEEPKGESQGIFSGLFGSTDETVDNQNTQETKDEVVSGETKQQDPTAERLGIDPETGNLNQEGIIDPETEQPIQEGIDPAVEQPNQEGIDPVVEQPNQEGIDPAVEQPNQEGIDHAIQQPNQINLETEQLNQDQPNPAEVPSSQFEYGTNNNPTEAHTLDPQINKEPNDPYANGNYEGNPDPYNSNNGNYPGANDYQYTSTPSTAAGNDPNQEYQYTTTPSTDYNLDPENTLPPHLNSEEIRFHDPNEFNSQEQNSNGLNQQGLCRVLQYLSD